MISKGTTHNNGTRLAVYMTTGKDGEKAELWQMRGFAATNIKDAFRDVQIMAQGTHCEQPFFHVQVRNREGEYLTRQQWEETADRIERMLGLQDQPRAIAFHIDEKTGHEHMHAAWSRIDQDTLTAKHLPFYKLRLKKISRELELHFGLEPVTNRRPDKIKFAPTRAEEEQARRLGFDIHEIRNTIRQCWDRSDSGSSFQAALAEQDLILAQGDRRSFIVIDREGGLHALGKRILDVTAAGIRQRLGDIDGEALPTVNMARAEMIEKGRQEEEKREKERAREQENIGPKKEQAGEEKKEEKPLGKDRSSIRLAYSLSATPQEFQRNLEEAGFSLARATKEEAERSHRLAAFAREAGRHAPEYREGEYVAVDAKGHVHKLDERATGDSREEVAGFLRTLDVSKHESIQAAQERQTGKMRADDGREFWRRKGGPHYQFQEEAGATTQRIEAPDDLRGPAAEIWNAYQRSGNARAFAKALTDREFEFAVVTKDDVARSQIDRHYATDMSRQLPAQLREGDIVAVAPTARVYNLNKRTTGENADRVQKALAALDRSQLSCVYDAVRNMEERGATRELERQAFRDLSRSSFAPEKDTRPKGRLGRKIGSREPRGVKPLTGAADAAFSALSKTLDAASDAVASLFAPTLSPGQIAKGERAQRRREAEGEDAIDFANYTADLAQQRRQEQEREAARERERLGRER